MPAPAVATTLRIFSLPAGLAGIPHIGIHQDGAHEDWTPWLERARDLGFSHVLAQAALLAQADPV